MKAKKGTTKCTLNDLTFPVELRDNPRKTNSEYNKVVTGIIDGEEIDLNYCSSVYELIPNETIFPKVEDIFRSKGIAFSVDYSHSNNARFYGNYTIEDPRFGYRMAGTNDVIKFVWRFQHSYNGLTKYKGIAGFYRLICSNGLTIPVAEMKEYNLCIEGKHTSTIIRSLEEFERILIDVTNNLGEVKTAITDRYETLGNMWVVKPEKRIEEVLEASGIIAVDNNKFSTVNDIMNKINKESQNTSLGYNGKVNDWLIYNGINQYIHDDSRNIAAPEKRRETDSKVLEYLLTY